MIAFAGKITPTYASISTPDCTITLTRTSPDTDWSGNVSYDKDYSAAMEVLSRFFFTVS